MLGDVQASFFLFFADANANSTLDYGKYYVSEDKCKRTIAKSSDQLGSDTVSLVEDADRQGSPNSANTVNRYGSYGVVNFHLVEE